MHDNMNILGVCRFSMLGRGDWKAYRNQPDDKLEEIYEEKARELFAPDRMENRLATFEHLTLKSLAAQSDQDFRFLVVASDRLPADYRERLVRICAGVKAVVLRFVPPTHISDVIRETLAELAIAPGDTLQFRLDDDDCVSKDFIRRARRHATAMWENQNFAISFAQQYYCVTDGPTEGIYNWYSPFFSAGAMTRHRDRTVFDWGHYQIPSRMVSVTDPHFPNIVTHRGDNDTPRHEARILKKRGMVPASVAELRRVRERHFDFLDDEGLALCRLDQFVVEPT
ncbi:putative rhamnosyl transferase [Defluviimonas sp. WL0024]|uniref:Rhamnosyl transferase n=2 Tax=Albidovulum TaxID=205889 RepID=A0ABT3IXN6_9RHOB|nr:MULTISPECIES: putative rhamnosyl transferase [Defluviimonas]MCU9846611.1 putative rhamnosyl transferase [Defluviimonas sp. WL0024]MCW3780183.1 putative rhamnosyl transferase [Defluviimonas salinarum]